MKREWYEYAVSYQKRIQRLQGKSLVPAAVAANVLIGIFLLPVFFTKLWLGLLLIGTYIPLIVMACREKDFYAKQVLFLGTVLLYFSVELIYAAHLGYSFRLYWIVFIPLCLILYEIAVLVKARCGRYGAENRKNKVLRGITYAGASLSVFAGRFLAREFGGDLWLGWLLSLLCLLILVYAVSFLQRYVLYKLFSKNNRIPDDGN